jgi:hypothetical protein
MFGVQFEEGMKPPPKQHTRGQAKQFVSKAVAALRPKHALGTGIGPTVASME